jgi:hypothetical protein
MTVKYLTQHDKNKNYMTICVQKKLFFPFGTKIEEYIDIKTH